jgi:hypothetical protein
LRILKPRLDEEHASLKVANPERLLKDFIFLQL